MGRGVIAVTLVLAAAIEPAVESAPDFARYAVTQGGLLAVVLVLLWSYRKDLTGVLQTERDNVQKLMVLVENNTAALTKSSDAIGMQAKSIEGLARAVEKIEERRAAR